MICKCLMEVISSKFSGHFVLGRLISLNSSGVYNVLMPTELDKKHNGSPYHSELSMNIKYPVSRDRMSKSSFKTSIHRTLSNPPNISGLSHVGEKKRREKKIELGTPFPGLKHNFYAILANKGQLVWGKK